MNKAKKTPALLSLLTATAMLLAACDAGGGTTATPTAVPATATTGTAAATSTTGGTTSGEVIKLVSSLPRTGLSKPQTDDIVAGYNMALDEHDGKAGGFTIEYEDWDDATAQAGKWDPATEQANATKAANDPDVMAYLGTFNSGAAAIAIPILNKAGLPMVSPANTAPELTKPGFDDATLNQLYTSGPRNYFRVVTADDVQGAAAANWATELGFKNAYILNDQEVYGRGVANVFEKQFKANGGTVIANEGIDPKLPEFKSLMNKIKSEGADLVYFGGLVDSGGPQLLKDLKSVAPEIIFMGPDGIQTQSFIDAAGADVAEGTLGTVAGTSYKDQKGKGLDFYNNFKTKFNKEPDPYAIYGYEAMSVVLEAIDRAGKKDRAAILEELTQTKDYEGALGTWSFDENGDTTLTVIGAYKVTSGRFEFQKYITAGTSGTTGGTTGGESGTIKLVSSLPRTGLSKPQTDDIVAAYKMALEDRGGKVGNFEVVYEDWDDATAQAGKWDPATEQANATKAANDPDIMAYLGTFNSGAAAIAIPILNKAGLPMVSPANTAPELTKPGFDDATLNQLYTSGPRNYFRVVTADDVQGAAAANWAIELGFKNAYILNDQEVYGRGVANVFEKQFKAAGGTVIANEGIDPKLPEFKALMNKIKSEGADLVYFGGLVDSGGPQLLKDLKSVAPEIAFMGPDGIQTQSFIDAAGADVAEGTFGTVAGTSYQDQKGKGLEFYNTYKEKFNKEPDPYAIYGYDAMNVVLDAIERAGKKDRAAILEALKQTKDYEGALGTWSFDENGDTTLRTIGGYKVTNGRFAFQKYLTP
jgi:branched-chain amino acid transport system substrate-binding protein